MNNKDRQIVLETRMYRHKTYGKEDFCSKCWAKCNGCIASTKYRAHNLLCVKAECRLKQIPFNLRECVYARSKSNYIYGLKKGET
jgi:hypothetical protein